MSNHNLTHVDDGRMFCLPRRAKMKARTVVERGEKSLFCDLGSESRLANEKEKKYNGNIVGIGKFRYEKKASFRLRGPPATISQVEQNVTEVHALVQLTTYR